MIRTTRLMLLVVALPVAFGACKKKQTPVTPPQTPVSNPGNGSNPAPPTVTPPRTVDPDAERRACVSRATATLSDVITFEYDSDALTADARAKLDAKLGLMNSTPGLRVRIDGHTDERGTDEYNMVLGRRRAEQAKRYLTDRGIDGSRIETMSYGRERPVAQGSNEEAWAQNRRDDFSIISGNDQLCISR